MFKKCKVIILPLEEKSNIILKADNHLEYNIHDPLYGIKHLAWKYQNLYITSDEEIKEGDWYLVNQYGNGLLLATKPATAKDIFYQNDYESFKVISSTNSSLELPQSSQSFINTFIEEYNRENQISDVEVEYEEQETNCSNNDLRVYHKSDNTIVRIEEVLKVNSDNTINIKLVKDYWNREEVIKLMSKSIDRGIELKSNYTIIHKKDHIDKWININL